MSRAAICVALLFLRTLALAAPLSADIRPLANRPRPGAPAWVEVNVPAQRGGLREGSLEFVMTDNERGNLCYRTHEIALIGTPQRFRFLLPNFSRLDRSGAEDLRVRFVDRDGAVDLGGMDPLQNLRSDRPLVVAVAREAGGPAAGCWPALRLERYAASPTTSDWSGVTTQAAHFEPADLPVDPLGYCAFDVVVIESGGFARVREKARAALGRWVEAGGSLCVVRGPGTDAEQLAQLDQIGSIDPKWAKLTGGESFAFARANYGRLVVAASPPHDEASQTAPEWRRACAFLWKLRAGQTDEVMRNARWIPPNARRNGEEWRSNTLDLGDDNPLQPLMPSSVRLIPRWVLATLAAGFILIIGPGDWLLLGALRRRRWTWLAFPVVAAGTTALTVLLARHFTGTATHRAALVITDLGVQGRVVRETRVEMLLPGRDGMEGRDYAQMLVSPSVLATEHADKAVMSGQFPARFSLGQVNHQWSPRYTRTLSLADAADTSGIRWDRFDPAKPQGHRPGQLDLEMSPDGSVTFDYFGSSDRTAKAGPLSLRWRRGMTAAPEMGLGYLVSQLSPTGSARLDDLACIEIGDTSRTLIVAIKYDGTDIRVWRRLYLH